MFDIPLKGMDFKQLRDEVQLLRDELAITKRKYEDLFYNLDDDNFSDWFIKEKNGFKIAFKEVFPNGVENESSITVNAQEISFKVSAIDVDNKLLNYSTITQTATSITSAVTAERSYTTNLLNTTYYTQAQTNSQITQSANNITSSVSATYETKSNASNNYISLNSSINQSANSIRSDVSSTYETKTNASGNYTSLNSSINQTATAITSTVRASYSNPITITSLTSRTDTTRLYYYSPTNTYYFWNGSSWEATSQANFGTVFEQTATGFRLKGNVTIDGITTIRSTNGYLTVGGVNTDLEYYYSGNLRFKIYTDGATATNMWLNSSNILGHNTVGNKTYPKGNWDFSTASVSNLSATFG